MATFKLTNTASDQSVEVPPGHTLVIGRAVTTDVPIYDPTVSRRHAEIAHTGSGLSVKDLGSSNGTFVNGSRVSDAALADGDVVTFGKVAFTVVELVPTPASHPRDFAAAMQPGEGTIIRQVPVVESDGLEQKVARISDEIDPPTADLRVANKLSLLLDISKELAKQQDVDKLLEKVVDITFKVMSVDRVAILMVEGDSGDLVPRLARNKLGDQSGTRHVPRSIAQRCVDERLAILTDNAAADERFKGKSILMQSVRSAMSAPLMGSEGNVLGLLYVDNMTDTNSFGDEDLEFLIAFSGIAAVAIENGQLTDKLAREAVVLSNFQRYFAPNLVEQIASQDGNVQLGGTKRPVVIFFTDIRGFTPMSETMGPDDIASLLTEYFTEMVQIVFEHNGTLDKFMGDALMALWGAPIQGDDDADRAMQAAIDMMRVLEELNEKWSAEGRPHVSVGIGINFGEVFAGNIGSEQRMEYTVIGDAVNIASRLCSKAAGGQVLVSEPFYKELKNPPEVEALEPLQLRGKSETVSVYQVNW
ncbi:MAG: FHA domain-containing protein [Gemmatimonadetes bacterium]|nr:FHA domain-containing protein [Gemmatimonadota bacterium]